MPTVSLVLTTFQNGSTALTMTLKAVPAVSTDGVPVLPAPTPGVAASPGTNNCNFANGPEFTVIGGLVLWAFVPSVTLVAVNVRPGGLAVRNVTLKVFVPEASAAFPGRLAFESDDPMKTVSVTPGTMFQSASTA